MRLEFLAINVLKLGPSYHNSPPISLGDQQTDQPLEDVDIVALDIAGFLQAHMKRARTVGAGLER
jgi:hypothetical protein